MTKQDAIYTIQNSASSIFTKTDVLKILNNIDDTVDIELVKSKYGYDGYNLDELIEASNKKTIDDFIERLNNDIDEIDADFIISIRNEVFSMYNNTVSLESFDVDKEQLKRFISSIH